MRSLLDTHFLIWLVVGSRRLEQYPWLDRYRPWGVSPVSFLEAQLLAEIGRLDLRSAEFADRVAEDPRFVIDEAPLLALVRHTLPLAWTRDPFDRLLAAHSSARRVPLCTTDRTIRENHPYLPPEMK
ncbi:MAG: type II toxin-antitoxin system VapC family toxin [Gemmatimonadota bacterium]